VHCEDRRPDGLAGGRDGPAGDRDDAAAAPEDGPHPAAEEAYDAAAVREDGRRPAAGEAYGAVAAHLQAVRRGVVDLRGAPVAGGHSVVSVRSVDHPGRCCGGNSRTNLQWLWTCFSPASRQWAVLGPRPCSGVLFARGPPTRRPRPRRRSPRPLRCGHITENIRLNQMVPATGSAHLDHVNRKLLLSGCETHQLLGRPSRTRHRAQLVAEDPGNQGQLLFPADRAYDVTALAVEFRGSKQVWAGITDLRDACPARVDLGQQRLALKRVVHHLPLYPHGDQSTCVASGGKGSVE
jgi:hypothetical protein